MYGAKNKDIVFSNVIACEYLAPRPEQLVNVCIKVDHVPRKKGVRIRRIFQRNAGRRGRRPLRTRRE